MLTTYLKRLAPPKTTAGSHLSASEVAVHNARMSTRQVEILSEPPAARIEVNDNYIGLFMAHFSFFVRLGNSFGFRSVVREAFLGAVYRSHGLFTSHTSLFARPIGRKWEHPWP